MRNESSIKEKTKRTVIWLLFFVYVAILLRLTVFRYGFGMYEHFSGKLNLELFTNYIPIIQEGHWFDFVYLFFGNIVWFIPWGLFFRAYLKQPTWISILSGTLLSVLIETLQYIFAVGDAELDDVILNTAGAVLGNYIGSAFLRFQRKREKGKQ